MSSGPADPPPDGRALDALALGSVLVVAPHPDDETIGCGGLLALLRASGVGVFALLLTDGEMSHPGSRRWPPAARAALRRGEFLAALTALGVDPGAARALALPDGALPGRFEPGFADAVAAVGQCLRQHPHDTLLAPWRRDPHADHRAGSAIARAANEGLHRPMRLLEYTVWAAERGSPADRPLVGEAIHWRLDIGEALPRKLDALAAHRSQLGGVIDDDPGAFTLPATLRARCAEPWETYFEVAAERAGPRRETA